VNSELSYTADDIGEVESKERVEKGNKKLTPNPRNTEDWKKQPNGLGK
jgi:hypothetical protein